MQKKIEFVRWGSLNPVKQEGFSSKMEDYHSPPSRKGLYAFVKDFVDPALMYPSVFSTKFYKRVKNPSEKTFKVLLNEKFNKIAKEEGMESVPEHGLVLVKRTKPKYFYHYGDVWHHLKGGEYFQQRGSWYKSSFEDFFDIYRRCYGMIKRKERLQGGLKNAFLEYYFLEVFIERIQEKPSWKKK